MKLFSTLSLSLLLIPFINAQQFIKPLSEVCLQDLPLVGGKNASLGQMLQELSSEGIRVPNGFAITTDAYRLFLRHNNLEEKIRKVIGKLQSPYTVKQLQKVGQVIRDLIIKAEIPAQLKKEIIDAYKSLSLEYECEHADVAVRSSATAEDLPDASFAGQQDTYLNVSGIASLLISCKKCFASLFTDRAIVYRISKGFDHFDVALSICVQKMVRSDLGCAGVAFSLDTESGFKDVVTIEAVYGLGEELVQGSISPDEYRVFKPKLEEDYQSIISKKVGSKSHKLVYGNKGVVKLSVPKNEAQRYCLSNKEITELAHIVMKIEKHYTELKGAWCPMDVEWAKDGLDGSLYIVQARPETIHGKKEHGMEYKEYRLENNNEKLTTLCKGQSIGQKIVSGVARVIKDVSDIEEFQDGEILVTSMTDPDWVPIMKKAAGIVTDLGGRTCHAAIVSRELGVAAIVGAEDATQTIFDGQQITLDCSRGSVGHIYEGEIPYSVKTFDLRHLKKPDAQLLVNIADPSRAFAASQIPFVSGVGLARLEFIIANQIKAHPMTFIQPHKITDATLRKEFDELTAGYKDKEEFFVDQVAQGIATIAAAFYPRRIIVRFSDFKSNEYHNLLGGLYFEPDESNPMLGLRGASRYYNEMYAPAFKLEVKAIKKVRDEMGLNNVCVMVPFVRTLTEADRVLEILREGGLVQGKNKLDYFMMCEIPSNVILLDEFAKRFNGFSIGSNDLTQFTLAVDRDSAFLTKDFNERDFAVQESLRVAVRKARANGKYIGICGQAPSDFPEIGRMLLENGISSLSLNPDAVIPFVMDWNKRNG